MRDFIKRVNAYYPKYLMAHRHPANKAVHMIGNLFVVAVAGVLIYFGITEAPFLFGLLPFHLIFTIYLFAWPGHVLIEKNKPATWKVSRWITKACDWKMMFHLATRQLKWDTRKKLEPEMVKWAVQEGPAGLLKEVGSMVIKNKIEKENHGFITWVDKP